MPKPTHCADENCNECEGIIQRTYHELLDTGQSDRHAYLSAVRVLELRHPGHDPNYYFLRVARWLASERWPYPSR
jgi:hypothetical protein